MDNCRHRQLITIVDETLTGKIHRLLVPVLKSAKYFKVPRFTLKFNVVFSYFLCESYVEMYLKFFYYFLTLMQN